MTEQKEERKSDREQKEEIEAQERRRKYHEIWEKVCKPVQYYSLYSTYCSTTLRSAPLELARLNFNKTALHKSFTP